MQIEFFIYSRSLIATRAFQMNQKIGAALKSAIKCSKIELSLGVQLLSSAKLLLKIQKNSDCPQLF